MRHRVLIIIGAVALSLWMLYPVDDSLKLGLDLNGGVQLVLRVKTDGVPAEQREQTVEQAMRTIERRVNELGVAEPLIQRYAAADQILVELPGVSDVDHARTIIRSTAQVRLTLVHQGPFPSHDAAILAYDNALPQELEVLPGRDGVFYVVQRAAAITGTDLKTARHSLDEFNRPAVGFTLAPEAARRFGEITERNINRPLATVLDKRVVSVATIQSRIDDQGQITAGTTFLSVTALYAFGGEALRGFAFTMMVGIAAGTYSTVFIASATAAVLSRRG